MPSQPLSLLWGKFYAAGGNFVLEAVYDLFFHDTQTPASKELVVIGAGFARTGTASLYTALEILGFHTYHMRDVLIQNHSSQWQRALREESADAAADILLKGGYNATVETPGAVFAVQLARKFPNAKVVLTTRSDPQKWLGNVRSIAQFHAVVGRLPWSLWPQVAQFDFVVHEIWDAIGCSLRREINDTSCLELYHGHNAKVRAEVPPGQLLDFHISQGWEPLCNFLGVPVPDQPFPHTNDKEGMTVALGVLTSVSVVFFLAPAAVLFWTLRRCCRRGEAKVKAS
ncbi:unnamed protein product [Polarella glacialis]|uniref:Protein-tyrosine sulfotransferase n=1 Tax=Polarella glacialis TaxID=89957 RepID=A0A813DK20_POLGL|nr:unnamed protein product [Polarella glacialis]